MWCPAWGSTSGFVTVHHPAQSRSQNQRPGTLRITIPGLENWKPLFWATHFLFELYFNFMRVLPDVSVRVDPLKTWAKLMRPFHCRHPRMPKPNLGKSGQPLKHSAPCGSYQVSLYWDSWLQVDNSTFPNIFKSEDEKRCTRTVKGKTFLCQTSGMWCFGAQRGTLCCLFLFATPALFFRQADLHLPKKSFVPGLMLISPDSSGNGALCWSIGI